MRTILITGANRGIGLELTKQYAEKGDKVIAVCRKSSPELDALDVLVESGVDVASDSDVPDLAKRLEGEAIDVLVNCAGILRSTSLDALDIDAIREQFEINSIGPLRVTAALLPCLQDGSKVGIVTSRMGSVDDNTSGGSYGYRMSKSAVNSAGKSLSIDLKSRGIAVALLHPGFVRTEMTGGNGHIEAKDAAAGLIDRLASLSLESTGTFWHANGEVLPW